MTYFLSRAWLLSRGLAHALVRYCPWAPSKVWALLLLFRLYTFEATAATGGTANLAGKGKTRGSTAFSTTTLTAMCLVNEAPVLEA